MVLVVRNQTHPIVLTEQDNFARSSNILAAGQVVAWGTRMVVFSRRHTSPRVKLPKPHRSMTYLSTLGTRTAARSKFELCCGRCRVTGPGQRIWCQANRSSGIAATTRKTGRRWHGFEKRPVAGDLRATRAEMQCEIGAVESR